MCEECADDVVVMSRAMQKRFKEWANTSGLEVAKI